MPLRYGERLLPNVVDERAHSGHERPFASLPKGDKPSDGFTDITYKTLATAVDRCAELLRNSFGSHYEPFMFIGPPTDFRYFVLVLGAMKAKCIAFFPSVRNSLEANISLIDQIKCTNVLMDQTPTPQLQELLKHRPMRTAILQPIDALIQDRSKDAIAKFPFDVSPVDAQSQPCMVLHTSGSTGIPKAATLKHAWFCTLDAFHDLPSYGTDVAPFATHFWEHTRFFMPFPNFHCASLLYNLVHTIYYDMTMVAAPVNVPMSASLIRSYFVEAGIETSILSPAMLKDVVADKAALESLGRLKSLGYGGAPMSSELGDQIATKTHLVNLIGPTETGMLPVEALPSCDWAYFKYSESTGFRFDPIAQEEREMKIVYDKKVSSIQAIFTTFPGITEYHTKDLYVPHPNKQGLWQYRGRSDDVIIFSNNLNFNPIYVEQTVSAHPAVSALLLVGDGQPTPAFLLEPAVPLQDGHEEDHKRQLVDKLWPLISQACAQGGLPVDTSPEMVIITTPMKPFRRAGKGSVQRKLSVSLYEDELKEAFARSKKITLGGFGQGPNYQAKSTAGGELAKPGFSVKSKMLSDEVS